MSFKYLDRSLKVSLSPSLFHFPPPVSTLRLSPATLHMHAHACSQRIKISFLHADTVTSPPTSHLACIQPRTLIALLQPQTHCSKTTSTAPHPLSPPVLPLPTHGQLTSNPLLALSVLWCVYQIAIHPAGPLEIALYLF